jgi:two-component system nitrate/nitrite response regulator NarL
MANILIADHHPLFPAGLESLLQGEGHAIVASLSALDGLPEKMEALEPDALIIDQHLLPSGTAEFFRHIEQQMPTSRVILSVDTLDSDELAEVQSIVDCVVGRRNAPQSYIECVRQVLGGIRCCSIEPAGSDAIRSAMASLSPRERDVAQYIRQGKRNAEIAKLVHLTEGTVKVHISRIFKKLKVSSRVQCALLLQDRSLS